MFSNIRFYVLLFSAGLAAAIYWQTTRIISDQDTQIVLLTQYYALISITYLYTALMTTPISQLWPTMPFRVQYIKARRAVGVSAFFFGLTHATMAFFFELGGFQGLAFLSGRYLLAISLSATALFILFLMTATSFDYMIAKLTYSHWKQLHRFVYIAAIFVLTHALLLGSHFNDLSLMIPQIFIGAALILSILELRRAYLFLYSRLPLK